MTALTSKIPVLVDTEGLERLQESLLHRQFLSKPFCRAQAMSYLFEKSKSLPEPNFHSDPRRQVTKQYWWDTHVPTKTSGIPNTRSLLRFSLLEHNYYNNGSQFLNEEEIKMKREAFMA